MGLIRETWLTINAVLVLVRDFFVRWFLPVHGDEEPELDDGWDFEDSETDGGRSLLSEFPESDEDRYASRDEAPPPPAEDEDGQGEATTSGEKPPSAGESDPEPEAEEEPVIPRAPIIAPPPQASERVARGSVTPAPAESEGEPAPGAAAEESASEAPGKPAAEVADKPASGTSEDTSSGSAGEVSPFIHEKETDQP